VILKIKFKELFLDSLNDALTTRSLTCFPQYINQQAMPFVKIKYFIDYKKKTCAPIGSLRLQE
jgi:hypothetical protein